MTDEVADALDTDVVLPVISSPFSITTSGRERGSWGPLV
jgi:hypothetical protein